MEHDYAKALTKEVRIIDRWVAYFSGLKHIKLVVYIVAVLEATISPLLPELIVAAVLSYRKDISWKLMSLVSAFGSTTGAAIMYFVGKFFYGAYTPFFERVLGSAIASYSERLLEHNTFVSMFVSAFTFLPDPIFGFLAGAFALSFPVVVAAFFLGRLIRVSIVAYFSYEYGDEAREYILKHTRTVTIVLVSLVSLYIVYKLVF